MPYKRTYRRRYRRRPRSRYQNYAGALGQLKSDLYKLKSLVNVEVKAIDTNIPGQMVTTLTPYAPLISGIAQGDTNSTRDGNSIKYQSVHGQFQLTQHASAPNNSVCRVFCFVDKQHSASGPSGNEVVTSSADPLSFRNTDYAGRFQVLYSRTFIFDPEHQQHKCNFNKKVSFHEKFSGATAAAADITRNSIYLLVLCDEPSYGVTITGNARVRYVDN